MKKKVILSLAILMGIGIGSIVTACNNKENHVQAGENSYLKYCGVQTVCDDKTIEIYEDTQHNKVVYVGTDGFQHPITISVSDLK
ncbi:Vmc-like lipoprotein signal peptide domain-containing protein [Clostridium tagluense]|uniref:Lipoprotein n=1 Tax=Clostridium tagluense TaxID=360422 RepID=A0A401UQB4_9CLOT|nr:hypothetical protein [Clostridium tagluense]GCD11688.1 hypothetical protein Ctaglu_33110 [Clostridium tagluense]